MDANQLIVPYPMEKVAPVRFLFGVLPLFYYSFEAKERGRTPREEATLGWIEAQMAGMRRAEEVKHLR